MRRCCLETKSKVALEPRKLPAQDRLRRTGPWRDRVGVHTRDCARRVNIEIPAQRRVRETGPLEECGRFESTGACYHERRPDLDVFENTVQRTRGRRDTDDLAALDENTLGAALGDDRRRTPTLHRLEKRCNRRLLSADATSEGTVTALATVTAPRIPFDHFPRIPEFFAAATDRLVVRVYIAFVGRYPESTADLIQRLCELLAREQLALRPLRPLVANVVRRTETCLPVHRRASAQGSAGEDRDAQIARRRQTALIVELLDSIQLALRKLRRLISGPSLEHDRPQSFHRELTGDCPTAGARPDHADIAIDCRRCVVLDDTNRVGADYGLGRRLVTDGR